MSKNMHLAGIPGSSNTVGTLKILSERVWYYQRLDMYGNGGDRYLKITLGMSQGRGLLMGKKKKKSGASELQAIDTKRE